MRLPRLRLPSLSFAWLGALIGRRMLLYVIYTVVLFVVFLLVTFPHDLLVRRALSSVKTGPVNVDFNAVNFAWHKGYELSGLRLGGNDEQAPLLECSHLWVRPSLSALVHGNPYALQLSAELYGGSAQGDFSLNNGAIVGSLQWRDLRLSRYRTLTSLIDEGQLEGRVSGQLNFEARTGNANAGQATGEITLDGATLTSAKVQGFTVPDLKFRQTKLKFVAHPGRFEIQDFNAAGDVDVQGSGQIALREPLSESTLNLRATVETSLATPDPLKALVALIPRAPGAKQDAPITITGTLGRPKSR